jgi:hypothetical protein
MGFDDVYLVSDKLEIVPGSEIDALVEQLGMPLPQGYREYMTTLGVGDYCDFIRVYPPERILKEHEETRRRRDQHYFWEKGHDVLSKEQVLECVIFADSIGSDEIIAHPRVPDRLYVLPRHDDDIYWVPGSFFDPMTWHSSKGIAEETPAFKTFASWRDIAFVELFTEKDTFTLPGIAEYFTSRLGSSDLHRIEDYERDDQGFGTDVILLFAKPVGGRIQLTQDADEDDLRVGIRIDYDTDHASKVGELAEGLKAMGFYETGRSPKP